MSIYPSACGGYAVPNYSGPMAGCQPYPAPPPSGTWLYRGLWFPGTAYAAGDLVVACDEYEQPSSGTIYQSLVTHCGDEMSRPETGIEWMRYWRVYARPGTPTPLPPLCPGDDVPPEDLAEHEADTTDVHGIVDTTQLVTKTELAQAIQEALDSIPPPSDETWETPEGAQEKADAAREAAITQAGSLAAAARESAISEAGNLADAAQQAAESVAQACCEESRTYAETLVQEHVAEYHTPITILEGVTAEEGWQVDQQELTVTPDTATGIVRLTRTGPDLDTLSDPQEGNIVPDLLVAMCSEEWCPPDTLYILGATGYGHGSMRIHATGEVYLLDWSYNNPLKTDHNLRWTYTFSGKDLSGS